MSALRVYFEKQGGDRLCGVHCLNSLLQGPIFTQVDLNKFASELDKEESSLLKADPRKQASAPRSMTISSLSNRPESHNVDDTGNFSLGVLERALKTKFGISVENAARREVLQDINRNGLDGHDGFVIHLRDHWFSARAVPNPEYAGVREWFFLDSLKKGPVPTTENELWGTLQGLIQSGNHVFVLGGGKLPLPLAGAKPPVLRSHQFYLTREEVKNRLTLPDSSLTGASDPKPKQIETDWGKMGQGHSLKAAGGSEAPSSEEQMVQEAILASLVDAGGAPPSPPLDAADVIVVMVRFPSGSRQSRRFAHDSTLADLICWVEFAAAPLRLSTNFALVGRGKRISKTSHALTTKLADLGVAQELFNLQL